MLTTTVMDEICPALLCPADAGRARIITCFRQLDSHGDGFVEKDDLVRILKILDNTWSQGEVENVLQQIKVERDGRVAIEDFVEWAFTSKDCIEKFIEGLESLEFQPPNSEDSEYFPIIKNWVKEQPDTMVRFIREDVDERRIVLEFWGVELMVYMPKVGDTGFFLSSSTDDPKLISMFDELNGMEELLSLPALLTRADEMFRDKVLRTSSALLRSYSEENVATESVESEKVGVLAAPSTLPLLREQSAVILDFDRIAKVQKDLVKHFSDKLGLEFSAIALLMMHVKWDDDLLIERFDTDRCSLMAEAGAALPVDSTAVPAEAPQLCTVCFADEADPLLPCGHGLCRDCWPGFLKCNLDSGTVGGDNCLKLKCPGERCPLMVPCHFFEEFLEPSDLQRYQRLWVLSFVNDNNATVWCPKPGCELCVGFF